MTGRGGHRARVPAGGWQPVERVDPAAPTLVRFVEERTGRLREFDFSGFPVPAGMQQWLAGAFARRTGPRSGVKRTGTARNYFRVLRALAESLAEASTPVAGPQQLTAGHIAAFRLRHTGAPGGAERVIQVRSVLRDDPELPEPVRSALLARPPRRPETTRPAAYDDREWQLIMMAARSDVRHARDRIRAGRQLLADYRAGALVPGGREARLASLLDVFDSTGDVPRYRGGSMTGRVSQAGGVPAVTSMLCLTLREMAAFCLLLCALTGENLSTVAAWPAVSYQPGGALGEESPAVALVEQAKPRRGPEREHMVTALEDAPDLWANGTEGSDDAGPGRLRSPVEVYRLLVEMSETSRRLGGHRSAFSAYTPKRAGASTYWVEGVTSNHVWSWARGHGFPSPADAPRVGRPAVEVRRIRKTVVERRRSPVSHTRATMNDHYLARSAAVVAESRVVVGDALREQLERARARQSAQVLTPTLLAQAGHDLPAAATRAGLAPGLLGELIEGGHDTVLAACTGHWAAPGGQPGQLCTASFLACLDCPNARALPRHLPVQMAMADRLAALAPHLEPQVWQARYEPWTKPPGSCSSAVGWARAGKGPGRLPAREGEPSPRRPWVVVAPVHHVIAVLEQVTRGELLFPRQPGPTRKPAQRRRASPGRSPSQCRHRGLHRLGQPQFPWARQHSCDPARPGRPHPRLPLPPHPGLFHRPPPPRPHRRRPAVRPRPHQGDPGLLRHGRHIMARRPCRRTSRDGARTSRRRRPPAQRGRARERPSSHRVQDPRAPGRPLRRPHHYPSPQCPTAPRQRRPSHLPRRRHDLCVASRDRPLPQGQDRPGAAPQRHPRAVRMSQHLRQPGLHRPGHLPGPRPPPRPDSRRDRPTRPPAAPRPGPSDRRPTGRHHRPPRTGPPVRATLSPERLRGR